jgi:RNA polymerase sigma-70 factor (ECF subfamily)
MRFVHDRQRVQHDGAIAEGARFFDDAVGQRAAEAAAARGRADKQSLHFRPFPVEAAQGDHSVSGGVPLRDEECSRRRRVLPRQRLDLVRKVLKRQIKAKPLLVLDHHLADFRQVLRFGGANHSALSHIFQPPLRRLRLMNVNVAGMTATLGAAAVMSDANFDAETTRLALRARTGDQAAFSALIDLHQRAARRVAAAALGNHADADEAVQEACLTAWRRIGRLDDPAAFRAWLLRITWRKALDRRRSIATWLRHIRQDSRNDLSEPFIDSVADRAAAADDELLARERDRVLAQMIRSLPAKLRDPFLLAATGEHRYEDIATMLGIPVGTVKWRMAEARRVLRDKLSRVGFGDRT